MNNPQAILSSCQQLAVVWVDTLQLAGTLFGAGILLATVLKLAATWYLTHKQYQSIVFSKQPLPRPLQVLAEHLQFPLKRIKLSDQSSHQAFTLGFLKPQIVFNKQLVTQATASELQAVFLHEYYHAKHYHPLLLLLVRNLAQLFFFLPIAQELADQLAQYFEQAADKFATNQQQTNIHVLSALRRVLLTQPLSVAAIAFSAESLESRIQALREQRYIFKPVSLVKITVSLAILAAMLFLSSSQQQIKASITGEMHLAATEQQCNIFQCASNCISTATTFSPNVAQSRM